MAEYNDMTPELRTYRSREELSEAAAALFVQLAAEASGRFAVTLAGGSTPKLLYSLLASENFRSRVEWEKALFLIGDERDVPADSPDSNFRMASETLLTSLEIPDNRIIRWRTELNDPENIAEAYEMSLMNAFPDVGGNDEIPRIDLVLLGLGPDAHTVSLFPYTDALNENERLAVPNWVENLDTWRYTITFPVINNAANVVFLVSGKDKAEAVRHVLNGEPNPDEFPAQSVRPRNGRLIWLLDEDASALLQTRRS